MGWGNGSGRGGGGGGAAPGALKIAVRTVVPCTVTLRWSCVEPSSQRTNVRALRTCSALNCGEENMNGLW